MASLTPGLTVINYEEYKKEKKFVIEPSRRGCYKETDSQQMNMFMNRQRNLDALWRDLGVVSVKRVKEPR